MQYIHSLKKATEFSNQAIERIKEENLLPAPYNYELWYVYYSKSNPDVIRAIDLLIENSQNVTDERCEELHQRFLSQVNESNRVRDAGELIQNTITDMSGRFKGVKNVTEEYNQLLEKASQEIQCSSEAPEKLRETIDEVMSNTKDVLKHNMELEQELEKSSAMMEELQRDLEMVRKQALTDGLTNLANRKAFDDEILRVIDESKRENKTFALVFLDIDHFKSFNDNYGHQVGDQVLRLVSKTLTDGVKGRDLAARYGGEEFALILPDTDLTGGYKVADALRKVVQGKELVNRNTGDVLGRITLSGGVAEYLPGEGVEQLIDRVDGALYKAKHNGRNQISNASVPKPESK